MLRMMEPELEEDFKPGQKKRQGSGEMLEEQKMRPKLTQVQRLKKIHVLTKHLVSFQLRKGARKEIRAEMQRAKFARAKDVDRQEKTKAIACQEGEVVEKTKKKF